MIISADFRRGAVTGALLTLIASVAYCTMDEASDAATAEILAADVARWRDSAAMRDGTVKVLQGALADAQGQIAALESRASRRVAAVRQSATRIAVVKAPAPADTAVSVEADTVAHVWVQRPAIDEKPYLAPAFLLDSWREAVATVLVLDSLSRAQGEALRHAGLVFAAMERRDSARVAQINALYVEKTWWEKKKTPRCGKRCGAVIGVLGTIGTAVVVDQVRQATK